MRLLEALWALDHGLQSHSKRMQASLGVTSPQRLVLRLVELEPDITPSELARILHFHKSTVTVIVRSLERAGLVERFQSRLDGRSIVIRSTPNGRAIARRTRGTVESIVRHVVRKTSASRVRSAQQLLETLASGFELEANP